MCSRASVIIRGILHERTPGWRQNLGSFSSIRFPAPSAKSASTAGSPGSAYEDQEDVFVWQLRLAAERDLPVSIHCLQAWGRLHELLRDNPLPSAGVFSCTATVVQRKWSRRWRSWART